MAEALTTDTLMAALSGMAADAISKPCTKLALGGNLAHHKVNGSQPTSNFDSGDDRETIRAALQVIDPDLGYQEWLSVLMGAHSVDSSGAMLALVDEWSRGGTKYKDGEVAGKWQSFEPGGGTTVATIAHLADQTGRDWRPKRPAKTDDACRQKSPETRRKSTFVDVDTLQLQKFTPFPVELLPEPLKGFVQAGALSIGCDPSAIAIAILVACASAIGNSRVVRLKNDWFEPAILWAALVARSGDRKSPAIALALQALRERQKRALKEYDRRHEEWLSSEMAQYECDLATWKKNKNSDKGSPPEKPVEPVPWRVMVDDCTIEALGDRLSKQPRGLLLACDELSAWLGSFQRYKSGGGSDAPKWLEVHGGRMLLIDRKGGDKKTLCIPRAAVSIIGTIQPSILRAALTPEHRGSGMAARLFLAMPPSKPRQWSEHEVPDYISQAVSDLFDALLSLEMLPGEHIDDDPRPAVVHLSPEAKELFIQFVNEHGIEQADMSGDMAAVWSKLEGGAARISLVLHLVRCATRDIPPYQASHIDAASMAAGIKLARWFGREAQRVESLFAETDEQREARELVEWIEKRGGSITARDLQNSHRRYSHSADIAEAALAQLAKAGLGKTTVIPTGGRPRFEFVLNSSLSVDIDISQKPPGMTGLLSTA